MSAHMQVMQAGVMQAGLDAPLVRHETPRCDTVVVLGGGGFVGSAIIEALAQAGLPAISAQHHASHAPRLITQRHCDATKPAEICDLLQGASWVVNAVGGHHRTMLTATHAMAAAANGWCRMVHISSMAVYGDARGYVGETAPLRAASRYGAAKIACENALAGTGATILRPGLVYGPGSVQWVGRIGRLLRARRLGDLGKHGDGRCNLVHAHDLGRAVVAAIRSRDSHGRTMNIGMTAPPRWNDFLVAFGRSIGAVPVARIAGWRLAVEAAVAAPPLYLAKRMLAAPGTIPEPISPALLKLFAQDIALDCTRSHRLLGPPRIRQADGLAQSAAWFLETHGLHAE
jgi:nucleoside-diphosphate-sugar epimerase